MTTETDREWYLMREGKRYGPFFDADLDRFHRTKQLQPTDLLWHQRSEWQPASSLFEFERPHPSELPLATTKRRPPPPDPAPIKRSGYNGRQLAQRLLGLKDRLSTDADAWRRWGIVLCIVVVCTALGVAIGGYIYRLLVD
jgi:hypothetical protein